MFFTRPPRRVATLRLHERADGRGMHIIVFYHIVKTGGTSLRHREFVTFHSERTYPEYLVAYQRV